MSNRFFSNHPVTSGEWSLVPEALLQLFVARLRVSLMRSEKYLPIARNILPVILSKRQKEMVETIGIVINGIAVRTPWSSTCLVKALAANKMLAKKKIPHSFHLGVQKTANAQMKAHAWISVAGKIIIGGEEAGEFKEILSVTMG